MIIRREGRQGGATSLGAGSIIILITAALVKENLAYSTLQYKAHNSKFAITDKWVAISSDSDNGAPFRKHSSRLVLGNSISPKNSFLFSSASDSIPASNAGERNPSNGGNPITFIVQVCKKIWNLTVGSLLALLFGLMKKLLGKNSQSVVGGDVLDKKINRIKEIAEKEDSEQDPIHPNDHIILVSTNNEPIDEEEAAVTRKVVDKKLDTLKSGELKGPELLAAKKIVQNTLDEIEDREKEKMAASSSKKSDGNGNGNKKKDQNEESTPDIVDTKDNFAFQVQTATTRTAPTKGVRLSSLPAVEKTTAVSQLEEPCFKEAVTLAQDTVRRLYYSNAIDEEEEQLINAMNSPSPALSILEDVQATSTDTSAAGAPSATTATVTESSIVDGKTTDATTTQAANDVTTVSTVDVQIPANEKALLPKNIEVIPTSISEEEKDKIVQRLDEIECLESKMIEMENLEKQFFAIEVLYDKLIEVENIERERGARESTPFKQSADDEPAGVAVSDALMQLASIDTNIDATTTSETAAAAASDATVVAASVDSTSSSSSSSSGEQGGGAAMIVNK